MGLDSHGAGCDVMDLGRLAERGDVDALSADSPCDLVAFGGNLCLANTADLRERVDDFGDALVVLDGSGGLGCDLGEGWSDEQESAEGGEQARFHHRTEYSGEGKGKRG